MMGRVSGSAQIVAAIVMGVGGAIFYMQRNADDPSLRSDAPNIESEFRALYESDSDDDLAKERSRLHEAVAREIAAVADGKVARGEHTPGPADAPLSVWGADELTVRTEAEGQPVLVVLTRSDAPDVFRLHDKHAWITSILTARGVPTQ